jgi:hypothetical protein
MYGTRVRVTHNTSLRDLFAFHYDGKYYRCVALPFSWGRSTLWFAQIMAPMVKHLRVKCGFRVLSYLDDFLVCPSKPSSAATASDCRRATRTIDALLTSLGMMRHPSKGKWIGATRVEHLGNVVDTATMKFYVAPRKAQEVKSMANSC